MTTRIQNWLLKNTSGLQYLVNERLATRPGLIGRIFKNLEIGRREYSGHALLRTFRVFNYVWIYCFHIYGMCRPVGSRFLTSLGNGPLNYSGLFCYFWCTAMILARCELGDHRAENKFNEQDGASFWFEKYNMMFPPSYLNNRQSAHYIEIN